MRTYQQTFLRTALAEQRPRASPNVSRPASVQKCDSTCQWPTHHDSTKRQQPPRVLSQQDEEAGADGHGGPQAIPEAERVHEHVHSTTYRRLRDRQVHRFRWRRRRRRHRQVLRHVRRQTSSPLPARKWSDAVAPEWQTVPRKSRPTREHRRIVATSATRCPAEEKCNTTRGAAGPGGADPPVEPCRPSAQREAHDLLAVSWNNLCQVSFD